MATERTLAELRNQVAALSKDCYYLISLLNTTENIDWDNWPEGQAIREHLEKSRSLLDRTRPQLHARDVTQSMYQQILRSMLDDSDF